MKKRSMLAAMMWMACLIAANLVCLAVPVQAKELTKTSQVKKMAKKEVKGATVWKVEKERDDGGVIYEVDLSKGKKEYHLIYRASDARLISYEWEIKSRYIKGKKGTILSKNKCRTLAKKQVAGGSITKIAKKRDDGITIYKVKMEKGSKRYELRFHAVTGALLEYEWELKTKTDNQDGDYISEEKACEIALEEAGGGTVIKVKFEKDDGVCVYEVDVLNGGVEYEIKIDARTGKVLEVEKDQPALPPQEGTDPIALEAAKEIALADAGVPASAVTYTKTKSDWDDGVLVYEIEFVTAEYEYEYEIHASTGKILSKKKEALSGGGNVSGQDIGLEAAKQIALEAAGGGTVVKAKADIDDGVSVYEIEILNGGVEYELTIDASTGEILEIEAD